VAGLTASAGKSAFHFSFTIFGTESPILAEHTGFAGTKFDHDAGWLDQGVGRRRMIAYFKNATVADDLAGIDRATI
jgi:hypothetical protein